jgi:hypothetical protein
MSLSNILKEMDSARPQAEMDVQMGSPQTYGGRVGLKRAAIDRMERLRSQYQTELMASTLFIVVTGKERDSFTQIASSDKFECFAVDSDDFYKDLTSRISPPNVKPSLFGRETPKNLFNVADNVLRDMAMDLGIRSYPPLSFNDKYNSAVNTAEDFVPLIKRAINDQVGSEIVGLNAVHSIVSKAIEKKHSAKITPLILNTSDEKFAVDLQKNLKRQRQSDGTYTGLTDKVFLIVAGKTPKSLQGIEGAIAVKTVSEENVGDALTAIKNKL